MATVVTVVFGIGLGMTGYTIIWPLFGAANQLLAALALLAVCAWLGNAGKHNRMFYLPMVFMLAVTVTSLCMTIQVQGSVLLGLAQGDLFTGVAQTLISALLLVMAIILAFKGAKTVMAAAQAKKDAAA